jgi:hypothetical protein
VKEHAVPRYFFHVKDGRDLPDMDGCELPSLAEVRAEALRTAGEMLKSAGGEFWNHGDWHMDVRDEAGRSVLNSGSPPV